ALALALALAFIPVVAVVALGGLGSMAGIAAAVLAALAIAARAFSVVGMARPGARPADADRAVDHDRMPPSAVGVDLSALERVEGRRAGLDAHALGNGAPALAGVALVFADHVAAGHAQGVRDSACVVDVARRPAAAVEQVDQQRARRAVVPGHLVEEGIAVVAAVVVDLAQARIHPYIAGPGVVADGLGGRARCQAEAEGEREDAESTMRSHGCCSWMGDVADCGRLR